MIQNAARRRRHSGYFCTILSRKYQTLLPTNSIKWDSIALNYRSYYLGFLPALSQNTDLILQTKSYSSLLKVKNLEESKMSDADRIENELKTNWKRIENELKSNWKWI